MAPHSIEPIVGDWYQSHGQLFEVVAIDEAGDIVEIQHADGDLEEIDMDDWYTRCRAGSLASLLDRRWVERPCGILARE